MKGFRKLLLSFVLLIIFSSVHAYEITYSNWSEIKPDVEEYLIESEDRFLFYKEKEVNVEYLMKDDFNGKLFDLDDYKDSEESKLLDERPEEKEGRIISEVESEYDNENNIYKLKLSYDIGVYISEIEVISNRTKIDYEVDEEYEIIKDENKDEYVFVKDLVLNLNNKYNLYSMNVTFYYRTENDNDLLVYKCLNDEDKELYTGNYDFKLNPYKMNNYTLSKIDNSIVQYKYVDRLYKTYEIEKEYEDEYYTFLDGYIKDESTKKTFYRYITNEHLIVDARNEIVKDPETYCIKEYCSLIYLTKEEESEEMPPEEEVPIEEVPKEKPNIPINPKTIDNIHYYFIALFVSLIISILLFKDKIRKIFLVLSNRFKRV